MTTAIENLQSAQAHAISIRPKAGGFPVLAKVLHQAGVHRNEWFLPAAQSLYVTDLGAVVQQGTPIATGSLDVPPFDRDALIRTLRADQAGMAAGLLNSSRQVGGTLAVAVFGALISHRASFLPGLRASLLIAVVVLAVAATAAFTLPWPQRETQLTGLGG